MLGQVAALFILYLFLLQKLGKYAGFAMSGEGFK